jgi:DNA-binding NarL/FixJ family response regulator
MYADFDETFLTLFPHFIERFNDLFEEADRKMPDTKQSLTTEMRIFALIRLGINDADRIAQFLNYSVNTINTYKTRVKNKSIANNDEFEQKIMEI